MTAMPSCNQMLKSVPLGCVAVNIQQKNRSYFKAHHGDLGRIECDCAARINTSYPLHRCCCGGHQCSQSRTKCQLLHNFWDCANTGCRMPQWMQLRGLDVRMHEGWNLYIGHRVAQVQSKFKANECAQLRLAQAALQRLATGSCDSR